MKPLGIELRMTTAGPVMRVSPANKAADDIWAAVESAVDANMSPQQFIREARAAWEQKLRDTYKAQMDELSRR